MRCLLYLEPFIERQSPSWKTGWLDFAAIFKNSLSGVGTDFRVLLGEALQEAAQDRGISGDATFIANYQPLIEKAGRDYLDITSRWYFGELGAVRDVFSEYLKRLLGAWKPDVILSFSPVPFLQRLFPEARVLHVEVGIFSRKPFPLTLYFDPCGMFKDSLLCRQSDRILAFRASQEELAFVDKLRHIYIEQGVSRLLPRAREIYGARLSGFRKKVLLPLQFSGYYAFDANCRFGSQFDYLQEVLEKVPQDIAVVVTEHPDNPSVTDDVARYLARKYPHFVWSAQGRDIYASSQVLMLMCDAVITVSSAVGIQALLYERPVISIGNSYVTPFADGHCLSNVVDVLNDGYKSERSHVLYWLLSRYYVGIDSVCNSAWFERFCRESSSGADDAILYSLDDLCQMYLATGSPDLNGVLRGCTKDAVIDASADPARTDAKCGVRAIAFHLPQFHAIPENDAWWGKGFTEWDNVRQGQPLFDGHYQPRVPAEMGYYDLSDVRVLERQARLAREHGVEGFCFYYYWFDGQRLLEKPVDQLLRHPEIDLPFCLCWANENWTRRWDGGEQQVLMRQSYSPELDERFALDLLPYLRDARYIRIDGRPLLVVYRLDIIPEVARAAAVWREVWRREGIGEVYLIAVESFRSVPPDAAGFDAACEFLPHQVNFAALGPDMPLHHLRDSSMNLADYAQLAEFWLDRPSPAYKRFRGIVPAWDNAARRRKGGATVIHGSTPQLYEKWLRGTVARTLEEREGDERIVFINAWNEWGEGCYLEPDEKFGHAYLEATQRVLRDPPQALLEDLRRERAAVAAPADTFAQWLQRRDPEGARARMAGEEGQGAASIHVVIEGDDDEAIEATRRSLLGPDGRNPRGLAVSVLPAGNGCGPLQALMARHAQPWWLRVPAGVEFLPAGLEMVLQSLQRAPAYRAVYADEMVRDPAGALLPILRPDFNLDLLLSFPGAMARHWLFHRDALAAVGGFVPEDGGAFELGALLRMAEDGDFSSLCHVPEPFLVAPLAVSASEDARRVALDHLRRRGYADADVANGAQGTFRVLYGHGRAPLVSVIIPTKDQLPLLQQCVETLLEKTAYRNFEVLIVDNGSSSPEALVWLDGIERMGLDQLRVLRYPLPFNYSAMNNLAARQARGEYLLLLNNDTAVLQGDWLDGMLNHAQRPEVGIVGAKLLYPDGRIQHAGVVLGLNGPADHPHIGDPLNTPGHMHRLLVDQDLSAVTGACLMVRKSLYEEVGGLDEEAFKVSYNDVDLCLKVRQAGYLVVWTPHVLVMHVGSVSQKSVDKATDEAKHARFAAEQDAMYAKWLPVLAHDPAYHRHFALDGQGYQVEPHLRLPAGAPARGPKVLAHPADGFGCGHYRVIQPWRALHAEGRIEGAYAGHLLRPPELERYAPDVIVLQRQLTEVQLASMRRMHAFSQAFKVYELDDYLPSLPVQSAHRQEMQRDVFKALRQGLKYVDRFVVSTEPLAEAFAGMHPDIRVVENRLPLPWWGSLNPSRRRSAKPRVGWAGGVGHAGDLALVADVVRALAQEVEWVFFGMCPQELLEHVHECHLGVPIDRYPGRLASLGLDLAIAPLEDNMFNACKSQLKLLEYGACGYPVVCSDVGPYRRSALPVTKVRNRFKDWVNAIRGHIHDLDASARAGAALQEAVRRDWMLQGVALDAWQAAWTGR